MKKLLIALALALTAISIMSEELKFVSIDDMPLYGTSVQNASNRYTRLPDSLQGQIRDELWQLGLNSAGLSLRFATNSTTLAARWKALNKFNMNHMTATGIRGVDLYMLLDDSTWTNVGTGRPNLNKHFTQQSTMISGMEPKMREYMLFLSLYDGIDSISIGIDSAATLIPPTIELPQRKAPIVMYGTSILQGGCATRPGMAHTNILQRKLNREVINLGFSGNARLDPEIARLMATVDASIFVLDVLPNTTTEMLVERIQPFYEILRSSHPQTPILLVENPEFPSMRFNVEQANELRQENEALRNFYEQCVTAGDDNLHYFHTHDILGDNTESTVDNCHFTDTGFQVYADALYPVIKSLIE